MCWSQPSFSLSALFNLGNTRRISMKFDRVLCHWELHPNHIVEYPKNGSIKMVDEKIYKVGQTVGK
jgi:hypothetical protein